MADSDSAGELAQRVKDAGLPTTVLAGHSSLSEIAEDPTVDVVMAAIVGATGLEPTLAAARAGKTVLLANKEALVMAGKLFMTAVAESLPPDPWWVPAAILAYFVLGILWALETTRNVGFTALSGNVSDWYFFRRDEAMRSRMPLLMSLCRTLRYHLGSIRFGSFIVALILLGG